MIGFNHKMLTLAREARGMSQKELAELSNIKQGTISKIENDQMAIGDNLKILASSLDFPESFFIQDIKCFEPDTHFFRKIKAISKVDLKKNEANINIRISEIEKLLKSVEIPDFNLDLWDVDVNGTPQEYAQHLRRYWRIPKGFIPNLVKIAEDNGLLIVLMDLGAVKYGGVTLRTSDNVPIIFLNKNTPGDRLRMTLAHEIGHAGMHIMSKPDINRDTESEAWQFAAELLMPQKEIAPYLVRLNIEKLANLKRYWKVSMASILKRANTLGAISDSVYRYLWTQMAPYRLNEPEELDVPLEKPTLINEVIQIHMTELNYSKEELSVLLRLNEDDLNEYYFGNKPKLRIIRF